MHRAVRSWGWQVDQARDTRRTRHRGVDKRLAHIELGRRGEDIALTFLEDQGLVLLARNWRCRDGELDLVLEDRRTAVFCEVKTRSGVGYGLPAESVTRDKMARIRRLANLWLSSYGVAFCDYRFDVVSVVIPPGGDPEVTHYRRAF
jgi:putative endonuclease